MHRNPQPNDDRPPAPPEAWVETNARGDVERIYVGVWERPTEWIAADPIDIRNDPDAVPAHVPHGGGRRVE